MRIKRCINSGQRVPIASHKLRYHACQVMVPLRKSGMEQTLRKYRVKAKYRSFFNCCRPSTDRVVSCFRLGMVSRHSKTRVMIDTDITGIPALKCSTICSSFILDQNKELEIWETICDVGYLSSSSDKKVIFGG